MQYRNRAVRNLLLTMVTCVAVLTAKQAFAQAALLLEQPYGLFGTLNPTGHAAIYLERVCAETPVRLRLCHAGEVGVVISRYKGMNGYDWIAIPLIPYLYAVDDPAKVPHQVDQDEVDRVRTHYKESELGAWGAKLPRGNFFYDGWVELVGTSYDRNTYAFRFATMEGQDLRLMYRLNNRPNKSHFNILFNNCADFDRFVLQDYFPGKFHRNIFPDAGITTPKRVAWNLVKYAKKHPETQLTVLKIPQVPGFRRKSHADRGVAETFFTNGYIIPIVLLNPYVAGGLLVDYLVQGRYKIIPRNPEVADADDLLPLVGSDESPESGAANASTALPDSLAAPLTAAPSGPHTSEIPQN